MPDPSAARKAAMREERDRFVALAFCWADLMLELDRDRRVVFAGGVTDAVLGRGPKDLEGTPVEELVEAEDRALLGELLAAAENRGRIEGVTLRLSGTMGPTAPLQLAGYFLPDLGEHFFLSFRVGSALNLRHPGKQLERESDSGLYDADAFTAVAGEALKADGAKAEDRSLTLLEVKDYQELDQRLAPESRQQLQRTIGACLKAHSVDGDAAGTVAPGRYGLVHGTDVDVSELEHKIADYAKAADPEHRDVALESATVEVGTEELSEQDLATGLMVVINRFRETRGSDFTLKDLSTNLSSLVDEAVESVETFKGMVANNRFHMRFQPIANTETGRYHHYEVLAGFPQAGAGGSPYKYITFAEETGLIADFDMAMAKKALAWLAEKNQQGHYRLAVNLSGYSIGVMSFVQELHALLDENKWAHKALKFEITESAQIDDLEAANRFIQSLRDRGHEVCLDDFGAGAANFQYLSALEVDVIKLDGPALKQAMAGPRGKAFLKALAAFCRELGIDIIAEMVDDMTTLKFIKDCGVKYAQGYLIGRPSEDIESFNVNKPMAW